MMTATKQKKAEKIISKERYFEGRGGRKTAVARVRLYSIPGDILVNGKKYRDYFKMVKLQTIIEQPVALLHLENLSFSIKVRGSGIHAQAEAVRNGIAKALVKLDPEFKKKLRRAGFITRDPRAVERKKYGLKKARRAPQWSKR